MKQQLGIPQINYWTRQPFLNRMRGASLIPEKNWGDYFLVPLIADLGRRMVLTWQGAAKAPALGLNPVSSDNRLEFDFATAPDATGQLFLRFGGADQAPTNVRLVPIEHEHLDQEFDPDVLADLRGFDALRFMDFLETNRTTEDHAPLERPDPEAYGHPGTVPEAVALANAVGARAWINLPHRITDANIAATVAYLDQRCARPPTIAFSNEIWNSQFQQFHYAAEQQPDNQNAWVGRRIAAMMRAAKGTKVGVLIEGQAVNIWHTNVQLEAIQAEGLNPADLEALSPATYVGDPLGGGSDDAWRLAQAHDVEGAIDLMLTRGDYYESIFRVWVDRAREIGCREGVKPYEGGMFHLNCNPSPYDWNVLRVFYKEVQLSPRAPLVIKMGDDAVVRAGGEWQARFDYATWATEWGFFGARLQPLTWAYIKSLQVTIDVPAPTAGPAPAPAPAPLPAPGPVSAPPAPAAPPAPPTPANDAKPTKDQIYAALAEVDRATVRVRALVKAYRK